MVEWNNAKVHVLSHGLHYGTGVFEGIRCYETIHGPAIFRLREHVKRMFDSAAAYHMKIPFTQEQISEAIKETVRKNKLKHCYIRPIAFYECGEMGLDPRSNKVQTAIAAWPWGAFLGEDGLEKGIRVMTSSLRRIDSRIMPSWAKATANYANSALAKIECVNKGFEECIMLNMKGNVAEGSGENVFIVKNGCLVTPPLSAGILEGITRDAVMRIARDEGIRVFEKNFKPKALHEADEAFFTGTAAEVSPIREVDGHAIGPGKRGPVTERIQSVFFKIVKGQVPAYAHWLEKV